MTPEICDEALKRIQVDWEVLPTVVDPRDGLKAGAPVVRIDPKDLASKPFTTGDVEAGFKVADHIVEFELGSGAHGFAYPESERERLVVGSGSVGS